MNFQKLLSTIMVTAVAVTMFANSVDEPSVEAKKQAPHARQQRRVTWASTSDGLGKYGTKSNGAVPSIGECTIPVVMVQFSDLSFKETTTVEKMQRYYNEEGYHDEADCPGSVRDYFVAQSGGQFVPNFEVVGVVTLGKSYKDYGASAGDVEGRYLTMPSDVLAAAKTQLPTVDFSKYVMPASNGNYDAGVPLLCMFYAGCGEATEKPGTGDDYIWPREWDCADDPKGGKYNNVQFNSFFVGNELNTGGEKLMGIGLFCHEFSHALGLPDFYPTDGGTGKDCAFGNWSVMETGMYVKDGYAPIGYTAYEKSYMGWLDLKEIGSEKTITLQTPFGKAANSAYIVRNSMTECFIIENRQPGTWYPEEYGSGVMVTRVAYKYNQWKGNNLNTNQAKKRCCMLTADSEKLYYSAASSNLYGNGQNSIASLPLLDGTAKEMGIGKITKNADGTITLTMGDIDPAGIQIVTTATPKAGIYTLDGRFVGTDFNALNRGLYIVNGKKVVK